ncbi:hypothetical protein EYF80_032145 [Liparis tanakae]|uniref:Uncharacterized protein n=1 Tax=Liparis tanakae TaxID=230148 RepID=A0A4Z2GWY8_9TELE|nr:hypothetical protein EYF80_032145 [Liparis tanakae]
MDASHCSAASQPPEGALLPVRTPSFFPNVSVFLRLVIVGVALNIKTNATPPAAAARRAAVHSGAHWRYTHKRMFQVSGIVTVIVGRRCFAIVNHQTPPMEEHLLFGATPMFDFLSAGVKVMPCASRVIRKGPSSKRQNRRNKIRGEEV